VLVAGAFASVGGLVLMRTAEDGLFGGLCQWIGSLKPLLSLRHPSLLSSFPPPAFWTSAKITIPPLPFPSHSFRLLPRRAGI
jgi:hypothetical protein